jgi:hypothetical protein
MPYLNSDGQSIIQDWIHPHSIAIVGNTLVVNQGGNSSHYFSCGCEFIFEEKIVRICGQYHEQRIAYTQASPRAVLEQIAKDFHTLCNSGGGAVTPVPMIWHDVEYVPNLATGFYDKVVHTWIDGVPQADVTTVTTYALGSPLPSTGTSSISTTRAVANGTVASGLQGVSFVALAGSPTVNGVLLEVGQTVSFEAYLDNVTNQFKRIPSIAYTASVTDILYINTID